MFVYAPAIAAIMGAGVDLDSADIRAILVKDTYVADPAHEFLSQITAGHRIGSAVALTSEAILSTGAFDAGDVTHTSVAAGSDIAAIVLYVHTGTESTSRLLVYIDAATGLPRPTNGGNVTVEWDNGTNRIFRIRSRT